MSSQNKTDSLALQSLPISLFFSMAISSASAFAFNEESMVTAPQATNNIIKHQGRVEETGIFTMETQPEKFPGLHRLPQALRYLVARSTLKLHDNPKLWEKDELKLYGYNLEATIFEYILIYWGQEIPPEEKQWIHELNRIEELYKEKELETILRQVKPHLRERIRKELKILEDVADKFDTKTNRVIELNIPSKKAGAFATEEFYRDVMKNEYLAEIARALEIRWIPYAGSCERVMRKR